MLFKNHIACNVILFLCVFGLFIAVAEAKEVAGHARAMDAPHRYSNISKFALMFDAGSSGTRMYIYQWFEDQIPSVWVAPIYYAFNESSWTERVTPGISTFANNLTGLHAYFAPFLKYAESKIPENYIERTYVLLYATAGMRLLPVPQQNAILNQIRNIFKFWPYNFWKPNDWVRIISGTDEGVFGWITTNYLTQTFQYKDPMRTYGAMDLGGASTQITFVPDTALPASQGGVNITLGGTLYSLYSYSYLGLGVDQARATKNQGLIQKKCPACSCLPGTSLPDGCTPLGYSLNATCNQVPIRLSGTSNYLTCHAETLSVIPPSECSHCKIGNVFQPPLRGQFYAMSAFAYPLELWQLPSNGTSLSDIEFAANGFCSFSQADLRTNYPNVISQLLDSYCFTGSYEVQLLARYGFSASSKDSIIYATTINGSALSWTLGAMVQAAEEIDNMSPYKKLKRNPINTY